MQDNLSFQNFQYNSNYNATNSSTPFIPSNIQNNTSYGEISTTSWSSIRDALTAAPMGEEGSLLDELDVNIMHIVGKTLAVLSPLSPPPSPDIINDSDLAGPLIFCLLFGSLLLLVGKIHFGYIYATALIGMTGTQFDL